MSDDELAAGQRAAGRRPRGRPAALDDARLPRGRPPGGALRHHRERGADPGRRADRAGAAARRPGQRALDRDRRPWRRRAATGRRRPRPRASAPALAGRACGHRLSPAPPRPSPASADPPAGRPAPPADSPAGPGPAPAGPAPVPAAAVMSHAPQPRPSRRRSGLVRRVPGRAAWRRRSAASRLRPRRPRAVPAAPGPARRPRDDRARTAARPDGAGAAARDPERVRSMLSRFQASQRAGRAVATLPHRPSGRHPAPTARGGPVSFSPDAPDRELDWLTSNFATRIPGVRSVVVLSTDGLVLAASDRHRPRRRPTRSPRSRRASRSLTAGAARCLEHRQRQPGHRRDGRRLPVRHDGQRRVGPGGDLRARLRHRPDRLRDEPARRPHRPGADARRCARRCADEVPAWPPR